MERKKLIALLCGVCGVLAGILMICAAVLDQAFPKPLWVLISILWIVSGSGNFYNYVTLRNKEKDDK